MSITANIFTYAADAALLPLCVCSLLQAHAEIIVHIIDDAEHPIDQDDVWALAHLSPRVNYRRSTWHRNGNLNGKSAALGVLHEMRQSCASADGVSIKIDSDTLLLNASWIQRCLANKVALVYSLRPPVVPSGICYLVANEWLERIETAITGLDLPANCAEDISILSTATALAHREQVVCLLPQGHGNPHGTWTSWLYSLPLNIIPQIAEKIDVITLGNWKFEATKTRDDAVIIGSKILDCLEEKKKKS